MNRLANETSPYLRQHADNPVDWYPWGDEAFAAARAADRPVLLSVGYASCHWCHVMAHESFEDPEVAALMNERFVNVNVDREERPDVDAVYMEATQALTGQGGWPMTVFLAPDERPFFAGTYFPRTRRGGMISFPELLERIDEVWQTRRADLEEQAGQITAALGRSALLEPGSAVPGAEAIAGARDQLVRAHDDRWGGFGGAPKFPQAMSLDLLITVMARAEGTGDGSDGKGDEDARLAVETSLDAMASGGIYDHVGGGFARYSVDDRWLVPHFEKMLYDQALLTRAYLHAWQVTGHERYLQVVEETIGYVLRDLRHADGGFLSSEDADSEGVEGKFYVWTPDQVLDALDGDEAWAAEVSAWYGVTPGGNFEGATILNRMHARGELARPERIEEARRRLFAARERRVRPGLDDKVLTEWNGLMLSALAEAAAATGRHDWRDGADAERLVTRDKDLMDNALPGANSLAAVGLLRLAALTGDQDYRDRADAVLRLTGPLAAQHPTAFGHLLAAVDLAARGTTEVVVAGDRPDLVRVVQARYLPSAVLAWGERYDSPLWEGREDGRAYVCRNYACQLPATDEPALLAQLGT